jgi:hypothetical protein
MMIAALAMAALAVGLLTAPASAAKTKKGCEIGKEVWNAVENKCVPGQPKRKTGKATKKTGN